MRMLKWSEMPGKQKRKKCKQCGKRFNLDRTNYMNDKCDWCLIANAHKNKSKKEPQRRFTEKIDLDELM